MSDTGDSRSDGTQDTPPPGSELWREQSSGIERIIDVAMTLDTPQTAGWVSDEAHVAEQTARTHLETLTDLGVVRATSARGVTKYHPDAAYLRFREISGRIERHSKDELLDLAEACKTSLEDVRREYDADSPDDLRARAAREDVPAADVADIRKAASEWETLRHDLDVVQEALERYEEFAGEPVTA